MYITLPNHLIKDKLIYIIEGKFSRGKKKTNKKTKKKKKQKKKKTLYLAYNEERAFFTCDVYKNYNLWSCQKVCEALVYLLDNIFIRIGTKVFRHTIGIPMGTNCVPLVADLILCLTSLQLVLCREAAVKRLPVHQP